jgi:xylulokinase
VDTHVDTQYVLAVDLGTSGCKTALVTLDGVVAGWAFRAVELHTLPGNGAEQDPADWWAALGTTTRQVLAETAIPPESVVAVCCSCQGEGTVPVDRQGHALMNALLWQDMRGARHIQRHARGLFSVMGYDALKLMRWVRLTGGAPSLSGKDPAAHMLYVRNERPEVYRSTFKFLGALDYLNLQLTGRFVATYDSILPSWVTDNRDVTRIRYHRRLVTASGIDEDKFPELVPCTEVIGRLTPPAAAMLGLPAATPVVAGSVDVSAAAIGSGAVADGQAHLYVGTSSWIGAHVAHKKTDVFAEVASVPCAVPGRYLMIAMQSSAGASLAFLKDRILYHHDELLAEACVPDVYKVLDRIASRVPAGSRGLVFTPWLNGERTPAADGNLRAGLFNLRLDHSREEITRAMFEGVALNTRWMLRPVGKFLGKPIEELTMIGGGAQSDTWCQIFADVLKVRVRQVSEPMQANAVGSARIAAIGLRLRRLDQVAPQTPIKNVYLPERGNAAVYDETFRTFLEIHRRIAPLYARLNAGELRTA